MKGEETPPKLRRHEFCILKTVPFPRINKFITHPVSTSDQTIFMGVNANHFLIHWMKATVNDVRDQKGWDESQLISQNNSPDACTSRIVNA